MRLQARRTAVLHQQLELNNYEVNIDEDLNRSLLFLRVHFRERVSSKQNYSSLQIRIGGSEWSGKGKVSNCSEHIVCKQVPVPLTTWPQAQLRYRLRAKLRGTSRIMRSRCYPRWRPIKWLALTVFVLSLHSAVGLQRDKGIIIQLLVWVPRSAPPSVFSSLTHFCNGFLLPSLFSWLR